LMGYRALVTFSRGGVLTAIICIVCFLYFMYYKQSLREKSDTFKKIVLIASSTIGIWFCVNVLTQGLIVYRYTNRDAKGQLEENLTTGRAELIVTELEGFYRRPVMGVGVGKA